MSYTAVTIIDNTILRIFEQIININYVCTEIRLLSLIKVCCSFGYDFLYEALYCFTQVSNTTKKILIGLA